jgi:hypothetical protein
MSEYTNKLQQKPTEYQEQLDVIDQITRQWAVMSQHEKDLENYNTLKEQNDNI